MKNEEQKEIGLCAFCSRIILDAHGGVGVSPFPVCKTTVRSRANDGA
jgi:hypothetical protein